jgi:ribosomal protein S18 acetylase RimI-like enzyme
MDMNRQRQGLPDQDQTNKIVAEYPAHLHINLKPGYQGLGIGSRLIHTFEGHMQELGVTGIYLTTSNQNFKAVPFYKKLGFAILYQSEIISHPHFDDLRFLIFAKKLLNHP